MESSAGGWLLQVCEKRMSGLDLRESFAQVTGLDVEQAEGMLRGLEQVLSFVQETPREEGTALDDERDGIAAAMRLAAPMVEIRLQKRLTALDKAQRGAACAKCKAQAHSVGQRDRQFKSLAGRLMLRRRVVRCGKCDHCFSPAQARMGLSEGVFTPRMEEACTMLSAVVPYEMAVKLLEKTIGAAVSDYGMQQMAERRGQAVESILQAEMEEQRPYDEKGLPRELPATQGAAPAVAYLEMDGVIPITREELIGAELSEADMSRQTQAKADHARGGKGKRYRIVGREVKNAILYEAGACAQESPQRGCLLDKRYVSHLGDWQVFAKLVWAALRSRGYDRAGLLVVLSDGAEWIRSLTAWLPIKVFLILDLYHVLHRISEAGNVLYADGTEESKRWIFEQAARIEDGRAQDVIDALKFLKPGRAAAQEKIDELAVYLQNNLDRMDYPAYRAQGLRVGSGAIESTNFHLTGGRLKLQGMRWSDSGAREMSYLRADLFNGLWEQRSRQILAA